MNIPKAFVHIKNKVAVSPTKEQLLNFFKEYGYLTLEDILEAHGNWEEVIREWFVNTYYTPQNISYQNGNNIFNFDDNEEEIELMGDDEYENLKEDGLILQLHESLSKIKIYGIQHYAWCSLLQSRLHQY